MGRGNRAEGDTAHDGGKTIGRTGGCRGEVCAFLGDSQVGFQCRSRALCLIFVFLAHGGVLSSRRTGISKRRSVGTPTLLLTISIESRKWKAILSRAIRKALCHNIPSDKYSDRYASSPPLRYCSYPISLQCPCSIRPFLDLKLTIQHSAAPACRTLNSHQPPYPSPHVHRSNLNYSNFD
jgi:hypothetical protein